MNIIIDYICIYYIYIYIEREREMCVSPKDWLNIDLTCAVPSKGNPAWLWVSLLVQRYSITITITITITIV